MSDFPTARDFYRRAYLPLRLRGKSKETKRLYVNSINNFALHLGREPLLTDFTDDTFSAWIGWYIDNGRSPHTANKDVGQLLAIWRYACRKGVLELWPDVALEPVPERAPQAWLRHELAALFKAIRETPGMLCHVRAAVWWSGLHGVLWDTAERIRAIRSLRWQYVDLRDRWVLFPAEVRKGRKRDRMHRLHADTCAVLSSMQGGPDDEVFPWPFAPTHIYYHYDAILTRAGLPTDRKSKFHRMRRSAASWFAAAGGDPMALLDHSSRRVTAAYLDQRIVVRQQAADVLFRPDK